MHVQTVRWRGTVVVLVALLSTGLSLTGADTAVGDGAGGAGFLASGVAALPDGQAVAVGADCTSTPGSCTSAVRFYDGSSWHSQSAAFGPGSVLRGVDAIATDNVWAVGFGQGGPIIAHWDGASWSQVSAPPEDGWLLGISGTADDLWAVGAKLPEELETRILVEHWNGKAWTEVAVPDPGSLSSQTQLFSVDVQSRHSAWAVGIDGVSGVQERWNGSAWSLVLDDRSSRPNLTGVAGTSDALWAVGSEDGIGTRPRLVATADHWTGGYWHQMRVPQGVHPFGHLYGVAVGNADDVWAVGQTDTYNFHSAHVLIDHWDGTEWTNVPTPPLHAATSWLLAVEMAGPSDGWAVGYRVSAGGDMRSLLLHWDGTDWTLVPAGN